MRVEASKVGATLAALGAVALTIGFFGTLPTQCGPGDNDAMLVYQVGAGTLAFASVMAFNIQRRASVWVWVSAVAVGLAIFGALFVLGLLSWVGNCTS